MRAAAWLLVALAAGACRSKAPVLQQYRLEYAAPSLPAPALPVVLRVEPLGVSAAYHRDAIAWRSAEHEVGTSSTHRWATTPPLMVTDLLVRDLAASGRYTAVVQGVTGLTATYTLGGELERIEADVRDGACVARVELRVLLSRAGTDAAALLQRRYTAAEPCACPGPEGFVAATSAAVRQLSEQVQRDVHAAIADDLARPPAVAKDASTAGP